MAGARRRRSHDGIFGSPPEPLFNVSPSTVSIELLTEWLHVLNKDNIDAKRQATHEDGYFMRETATRFMLEAAERLDISPTTSYLAMELFEKFMVAHVKDLYNHALGLKKGNRPKEWKTILDRVRNQLALRALSCCQLASKLTNHYKVVNPDSVRRVLSELGHNYSRDSVVQSEIRVLKTLKYRVMLMSPLLFVETLLEIMGSNDNNINVKLFYGPCVLLLDIVYHHSETIYKQLSDHSTGRLPITVKDKSQMAILRRDYMLQASAVIGAAAYIVDQQNTAKILERLNQITRIPGNDILDFAHIIVRQINE